MIPNSFCIDAAGNLIRLSYAAPSDQLIPYALEVASSALELAHPLPWTLTSQKAYKELKFAPRALIAGSLAEQALSQGALPKSVYVFVPATSEYASEAVIRDMFTLYDQLSHDPQGREQIESALSLAGIVPIPLLHEFNPALHEPSTSEVVTAYAAAGWISNTTVHRKAVIWSRGGNHG